MQTFIYIRSEKKQAKKKKKKTQALQTQSEEPGRESPTLVTERPASSPVAVAGRAPWGPVGECLEMLSVV